MSATTCISLSASSSSPHLHGAVPGQPPPAVVAAEVEKLQLGGGMGETNGATEEMIGIAKQDSPLHAAAAAAPNGACKTKEEDIVVVVGVDVEAAHSSKLAEADPRGGDDDGVNYVARAQWHRAAVLGAKDGLVSVASLMIGVGAVNATSKAMLVSGLARLVAGVCSMAIGEFVSVYAQNDIEVLQIKRDGKDVAKENRPAFASVLAFAVGALLPLLAGGFIQSWGVRVGAVCAASTVGLAGFGVAGAYLGGASVVRSGLTVLLGGWLAMLVNYGVPRLFGVM